MASTKPTQRIVDIYTDGSCLGNPGPGGWAAILIYGGGRKELSGSETETTNNRMELMAAIQALEALSRPVNARIHTDSTYLKNGITVWVHDWKRRGWRTAGKKPVKNRDLWERLVEAMGAHQIEWHWVKAHDGDPENERADDLARAAANDAGSE